MTHRKIKDGDGQSWDVWEVDPSVVEQRMSGEHPAMQPGESTTKERREFRLLVPSALQQGWLAFQCGNERRRLAPIPENWNTLRDAALVELLCKAKRLSDGKT
ncbi:MAG TPA: hypothetical protein VJN70_05055 [Gemmatimonadaceae bacterium]|nr:hypothetical protein [Gemmatimonadaceae bacterium]